jgi:hypothetical protein
VKLVADVVPTTPDAPPVDGADRALDFWPPALLPAAVLLETGGFAAVADPDVAMPATNAPTAHKTAAAATSDAPRLLPSSRRVPRRDGRAAVVPSDLPAADRSEVPLARGGT